MVHALSHAITTALQSKAFSNRIASITNLKPNYDLLNGIFILQVESPNVFKSRFLFAHHWGVLYDIRE